MSELSPSLVAGDPANGPQERLTPEAIDAILADFRTWLQEAVSCPDLGPEQASSFPAPIDMHTLVGHMVAWRTEVNLHTKAARAQQEQQAETLGQLGQALTVLQQNQAAAASSQASVKQELLRPLVKTLLDVHDALNLAVQEVQRLHGTIPPLLDKLAAEDTPPPPIPLPAFVEKIFGWWSRWIDRGKAMRQAAAARERYLRAQVEKKQQALQARQRIEHLLASFLTGYTMSLQRLDRCLQQHGLEPILCVGQAFDPELMEALEAVPDSGRPPGEVLEELRRGYLWNGRVFRYALVRLAK